MLTVKSISKRIICVALTFVMLIGMMPSFELEATYNDAMAVDYSTEWEFDFNGGNLIGFESWGMAVWHETMYGRQPKQITMSYLLNRSVAWAQEGWYSDTLRSLGDSIAMCYGSATREGYNLVSFVDDITNTTWTLDKFKDAGTWIDGSMVAGNKVTFYAQWEPKTYQMTLDGNGGKVNGESSVAYDIDYKETYKSAMGSVWPAFSNPGYTLEYFDYNNGVFALTESNWGDHTWDLADNATFTAKWKANNYTITYHSSRDSDASTKVQEFEYGVRENLDSNTFTAPVGKQFSHWENTSGNTTYNDGQSVQSLTQVKDGNINLYAVWEDINYQVTFNANGGTAYINGTSQGETFTRSIKYLQKYTDAIGTITAQRTGYTFDKWTWGEYTVVVNEDTYNVAQDATITANWIANDYTVTFNANDGQVSTASKGVTYDSTYGDLPTPTRTNYTFDGWYTAAIGGDKVTSSTKVSTASDHTLYAHWTPVTFNTTFTFNFEKDTVKGYEDQTSLTLTYTSTETKVYINKLYQQHSAVLDALFAATKEGYHIDQYKYQSIDNAIVQGQFTDNYTYVEPGQSYVLDQEWALNTYTVQYHANGGSGTTESQTFTYGVKEALQQNGFTAPTGKKFSHWNLKSDDSGTSFQAGQEVQTLTTLNNVTVNLYAIWEDDGYILTLDAGDGTFEDGTKQKEYTIAYQQSYSSAIGTLPIPQRPGYTFTGFLYSEDDGNFTLTEDEMDSTFAVAHNATMTAQWTRSTLTLDPGPAGIGTTKKVLTYGDSDTISLYTAKGDLTSKYGSSFAPAKGVRYGDTTVTGMNQRILIGWSTGVDPVTLRATGEIYYDSYDGPPNVTLYAVWGFPTVFNGGGGVFSNGQTSIESYVGAYSNAVEEYSKYEHAIPEYALGLTLTKEGCRRVMYNDAYAYALIKADPEDTIGYMEGPNQYLTIPITGGAFDWADFKLTSTSWGVNSPDLVAIWEPSVTYNGNGGVGSMSTEYLTWEWGHIYNYQSYTIKTNTYYKAGHVFTGWNTKADGKGTSYSAGDVLGGKIMDNNDPITLYAQWTPTVDADTFPDDWTVFQFHANGGHIHDYKDMVNGTHTESDDVWIKNIGGVNHITTYDEDGNVTASSTEGEVGADYMYYFHMWTNPAPAFNLADPDRAKKSERGTDNDDNWNEVYSAFNLIAREGDYKFKGYAVYIDDGDHIFDSGDKATAFTDANPFTYQTFGDSGGKKMVEHFVGEQSIHGKHVHFVAVWEEGTHTLTLDANGGSFTANDNATSLSYTNFSTGDSIKSVIGASELPTPVLEKHKFLGYALYNGDTKVYELTESNYAQAQYIFGSDVTLTAQWEEVPNYILSFDLVIDGTELPSDQRYKLTRVDDKNYYVGIDDNQKLADIVGGFPKPTGDSNQTFVGWYLNDDNNQKLWKDSWGEDTFTYKKDIELTAVWVCSHGNYTWQKNSDRLEGKCSTCDAVMAYGYTIDFLSRTNSIVLSDGVPAEDLVSCSNADLSTFTHTVLDSTVESVFVIDILNDDIDPAVTLKFDPLLEATNDNFRIPTTQSDGSVSYYNFPKLDCHGLEVTENDETVYLGTSVPMQYFHVGWTAETYITLRDFAKDYTFVFDQDDETKNNNLELVAKYAEGIYELVFDAGYNRYAGSDNIFTSEYVTDTGVLVDSNRRYGVLPIKYNDQDFAFSDVLAYIPTAKHINEDLLFCNMQWRAIHNSEDKSLALTNRSNVKEEFLTGSTFQSPYYYKDIESISIQNGDEVLYGYYGNGTVAGDWDGWSNGFLLTAFANNKMASVDYDNAYYNPNCDVGGTLYYLYEKSDSSWTCKPLFAYDPLTDHTDALKCYSTASQEENDEVKASGGRVLDTLFDPTENFNYNNYTSGETKIIAKEPKRHTSYMGEGLHYTFPNVVADPSGEPYVAYGNSTVLNDPNVTVDPEITQYRYVRKYTNGDTEAVMYYDLEENTDFKITRRGSEPLLLYNNYTQYADKAFKNAGYPLGYPSVYHTDFPDLFDHTMFAEVGQYHASGYSYNVTSEWGYDDGTAHYGSLGLTYPEAASLSTETTSVRTSTYAQWDVKVTYNANYPTDPETKEKLGDDGILASIVEGTDKINVEEGIAYSFASPYGSYKIPSNKLFSCDGKIIKEWNTKADGTGTSYKPGGELKNYEACLAFQTPNVVLYAIWEDACTFTLVEGGNATGKADDDKAFAKLTYFEPYCGKLITAYPTETITVKCKLNTQANVYINYKIDDDSYNGADDGYQFAYFTRNNMASKCTTDRIVSTSDGLFQTWLMASSSVSAQFVPKNSSSQSPFYIDRNNKLLRSDSSNWFLYKSTETQSLIPASSDFYEGGEKNKYRLYSSSTTAVGTVTVKYNSGSGDNKKLTYTGLKYGDSITLTTAPYKGTSKFIGWRLSSEAGTSSADTYISYDPVFVYRATSAGEETITAVYGTTDQTPAVCLENAGSENEDFYVISSYTVPKGASVLETGFVTSPTDTSISEDEVRSTGGTYNRIVSAMNGTTGIAPTGKFKLVLDNTTTPYYVAAYIYCLYNEDFVVYVSPTVKVAN